MTAAPRGEAREQFEAWVRPAFGIGLERNSTNYLSPEVDAAWCGWKAAIRALASPVAPPPRGKFRSEKCRSCGSEIGCYECPTCESDNPPDDRVIDGEGIATIYSRKQIAENEIAPLCPDSFHAEGRNAPPPSPVVAQDAGETTTIPCDDAMPHRCGRCDRDIPHADEPTPPVVAGEDAPLKVTFAAPAAKPGYDPHGLGNLAQPVVAGEAGAVERCSTCDSPSRADRYTVPHGVQEYPYCRSSWHDVPNVTLNPPTPLRPPRGEAEQAFYEAALAYFDHVDATVEEPDREADAKFSLDLRAAYDRVRALRPAPGANKEDSK